MCFAEETVTINWTPREIPAGSYVIQFTSGTKLLRKRITIR